MDWKDVRTGKEVTWGSGHIRAKITQAHPKTQECTVQLTCDYVSPCGRTFEAGSCHKLPTGELRYVS